jgi:sugar phosphate isomerase/epimerase
VLRLSLSTGILYHLPLHVSLALAQELEISSVELVLGPETAVRGPVYVRKLIQRYHLTVSSVHPPIIPYPRMRDTGWVLPRLVSFAECVGAPLVVLHTPKTESESSPYWQGFVSALELHLGTSGSSVRVSLENAGHYRDSDQRYLLHDMRRLRSFVDRYGLDVTLDTAHAGTSKYALLEAYRILEGRVANVHLSDLVVSSTIPAWQILDTLFRHHQLLGKGILPLAQLLRLLQTQGYSGTCTLEMSPVAVKAWSLANVRQALTDSIVFVRDAQASQASAKVIGGPGLLGTE